jgi:predicted metal-dependent phosphoesterase TrpH
MGNLIDLHTHSRHSDGVLSPAELVERAAARGVGIFALTDHDTLAGHEEARAACATHGIRFVPGVEMSCEWRGQAIHVIGLGVRPTVDPAGSALHALIEEVRSRRFARVREIGERLARRGRLPGHEIAESVLAKHSVPTRTHVARELVERGVVTGMQAAFDRWLGRDAPGHVPVRWPGFDTVVPALASSCDAVVLAHPHRYKLSAGALRQLASSGKSAGLHALEVSLAGMSLDDRHRVAALARRNDLAASFGSDFHDPATPWTPLGRTPALPEGLTPVTDRLT